MTYTEEIRGTEVYKLYDDDFNGLVVPTTQPSRVVSTKGTHRKLSTPRKPIQKSNSKKKWEKSPGESKIDIDRLTKAQQVTYDVAKSASEAEEKETLKKVEIMVDEVDEEEFVDYLIATQEDLGTRIETWSHKESPKEESEHIVLHKWDHDDHPGGPPEGDKNAKNQKTTRSTKSVKGVSSSKQSIQGSKAPSRSCVIWERVHDYQLGIESYQIMINLTALTLVIPCIEALKPDTISNDPFIGIVYENSKKERRVMSILELQKFYNATLNKVLKRIEIVLLDANHGLKDPPLS
ncbi:hypothetical protein Tco_1161895 [Tanacetum coccineum]